MIRSMKLFGSLIAWAFGVCIIAYPCLAWDSGAVREKLSFKVSLAELRFYKVQCGIFDHQATSSLIRRYQEPSISNLIMKLNAVGAYPQGVSDIFSGEAKELYLDAVHDGVIAQ